MACSWSWCLFLRPCFSRVTMTRLFVFGAVLMLAVNPARSVVNNSTVDFSPSDLKIPIDSSHEYEIAINNTSYVTIRDPTYDFKSPFKIRGNQYVTLHECVNFDLKIIYNEKSNKEEEHVHYNCKSYNRTTGRTTDRTTDPTTMSPNNHTGLIITIIVFILFAAVIVHRFKIP